MSTFAYRLDLTIALLVCCVLSSCQQQREQQVVQEQVWKLDSIEKEENFSHLIEGTDTIKTSFHFKYVYYTGGDTINKLVAKHFFGTNLSSLSPQELVERYYEQHKAYWQNPSLERSMDEESDSPLSSWVYDLSLRQEYDMGHILSYTLTELSYRHSTQGSKYINLASFDRNNLSKINEQDIFVEGYQDGLAEVIQMKIMQEHRVHKMEDLSDEGFFSPREISPNGNFMLTPSGLRYSFTPQEIAPYTWGNIFVDLTWDDISHLLRPASIVEEYI